MSSSRQRFNTASYTAVNDHTVPRTVASSKYIALSLGIRAREESTQAPSPPYLIYRRTVAVFVEVPTDPIVKDFRDVDELQLMCRGIWDTVARIVKPLIFEPVGGAWAAGRADRARDFMTVSLAHAGDRRTDLVLRQRPDPLARVTLTQYGDIDHAISCTRRHSHQLGAWPDVVGMMDVTVSFLDARDPGDPDATFLAIDRDPAVQKFPFDPVTGLARIQREADPFPLPVAVLFVPAQYSERIFSVRRLYAL
jgi:hypothetical protein